MFAQRHPKLEAWIESITIHFPKVVVEPGSAQHWAGDAGVGGQFGGQLADVLRASDEHFIRYDQLFKFIEKSRKSVDDLPRPLHPARWQIAAATAETHVVAHHARSGERFEQIQNDFALAECIHQRSAPCAHIAEEKSEERGVVLKSRELSQDHAKIFRPL